MPGNAKDCPLKTLRETCAAVVNRNGLVTICNERIGEVSSSLNAEHVLESNTYTKLPVRFESISSEINFITLMHLLDFGSAYDSLLMEKCKRDAREVAQFGLLGMYLTAEKIDSKLLKGFTTFHVLSFFGIDSHQDRQVMPGISVSRPGPLAQYIAKLLEVIRQTGSILDAKGFSDIGEFLLHVINSARQRQQPATAARIVEELVNTFPGFCDITVVDGQSIPFHRKAQLVAGDLYRRFQEDDPANFDFEDIDQLAADSGAILPGILRHQQILRFSDELSALIDSRQDVGDAEGVIRAAAVEAVKRISCASPHNFSAMRISNYLKQMADKNEEYSGLVVMNNKNTIAY